MYTSSRELRIWCHQNRNRVYVPEWLLKEWGIMVDDLFTGAACPRRRLRRGHRLSAPA
jgi:hypothetical protein